MTHSSQYRIWSFSLALFAAVLFLFPAPTYALTISPARLEISGDPGQTLTKNILLVNETDQDETYYASFANFEAQGESGTPVFVEPKNDLGTWMSTTPSITLKGGESKEIPLNIAIPQSATPGGHFAVLFLGTTPPAQSGSVSVGSRTGMLVLLSVTGEVEESIGVVDFDARGGQWLYRSLPVGFQYRFSNQGGDRIKPVASITIRSIFGWKVKKIDANPSEGNVLPRTTRRFTPEWSKALSVEEKYRRADGHYSFIGAVKEEWHNFAIGIFRAQLGTEFGTEEQRVKSGWVYFIVFPWELVVVVVPGAFILWVLFRFVVRRYNRSIIRKAERRRIQDRES